MTNTTVLNDMNFKNNVLKSDRLYIVNFWAEWVGSCHIIIPVIDEVSSIYTGRIGFGSLNIAENKKSAANYGISSVPTLLFFFKGEVVKQHKGIISKKDLSKEINLLVKNGKG